MVSPNEEKFELDDNGNAQVDRKRHKYYDMATKLEAIQWARAISINSASRKFNVDRKSIKHWMTQEDDLNNLVSTPGGSKRKRLNGGGRSVLHPDLDEELASWVRGMQDSKQIVSRRIISNKATELFCNTEVKISNGWLSSFMRRHNFGQQRKNIMHQKEPESYAETVANFFVGVEEKRKTVLAHGFHNNDDLNASFNNDGPISTTGLNILSNIESQIMSTEETDYAGDGHLLEELMIKTET